MISALEIQGVPIECINQAAVRYHVPATIILSVLIVEKGKKGTASPNQNGTFDYGPMQINSIWLPKIRLYGYTRRQLQYDPCVNVNVGTWILGHAMARYPSNLWEGVGHYHSSTPQLNQIYQLKVFKVYHLLVNYLSPIHSPSSVT
ncbi:conjugal transfer protein TrbN [Rickettsiella grylli]|uniref:Conjugal transfer protein TrbN n=2 Tax=Rickettsiella grylli TaxID=59196 RepID=A8PKG7_9COXI|nr:conjugal transfer protein TrbN [Rickettsiella grylli]